MVAREPDVSVRAGAGTELECVAHGHPAPSITWRRIRDNQVSVTSVRYNIEKERKKWLLK